MSLRKGSLQDYYNSGPGAKSAGCETKPGQPITCYQDRVERNTVAKLVAYIDAL
jgi:hypothetical protein